MPKVDVKLVLVLFVCVVILVIVQMQQQKLERLYAAEQNLKQLEEQYGIRAVVLGPVSPKLMVVLWETTDHDYCRYPVTGEHPTPTLVSPSWLEAKHRIEKLGFVSSVELSWMGVTVNLTGASSRHEILQQAAIVATMYGQAVTCTVVF